ncbi:DNA adenine methylase [Desulfovibrio falkowii]|uniref:DNA adenine methylase n=1 Tax=Desulfovibrio falkowii TaxID=3136602 RepID=A0ABQ0E5R1_9BACT
MAKKNFSPLRYPGGKSALLDLITAIIHNNGFRYHEYAEPYAGGGGLALALLYGGYVSHIHLNDINPAIWCFWKAALEHTADFQRLVEATPVTIKEWEKQQQIYATEDYSDPLTLGFATFFLNRTNRSGIIKGAGVIGGKEQMGNYKIDCRFNRTDLAEKICRIGKYKNRISLYRDDAAIFFAKSENFSPSTLFFIDPPYFVKGASLYTNFYKPHDHADVAVAVKKLPFPWLVTYDNAPEISELYHGYQQFSFNINYSLQVKRKGQELLITSNDIYVGTELHKYQTALTGTD